MLLNGTIHRMRTSTYSIPFITRPLESFKLSRSTCRVVVCAAKGPRPRYPRVWKTQKKIGTISKSAKLVECIKGLSNTKEEVYGALDSFIAWDLEFPLIIVKKALKRLENEKEWKRIIQVTKWMLSKGQGKTLGSYLTLLNALVEDDRLDEAEEIWAKVLNENLERTPRTFFEKMVSIYYNRGMHEKLFEVFADLDELGVYPTVPIVTMVGNVFKELGMMDKYEKMNRKFPPPKWEFRYIKGKRIRIRVRRPDQFNGANQGALAEKSTKESSSELDQSDSANEGLSEVEESAKNSSNLHMEASTDKATDKNLSELYIEATEAEVRINNSSELCEEKDEENNLNSAELYKEAETSSVVLNGEACVSS